LYQATYRVGYLIENYEKERARVAAWKLSNKDKVKAAGDAYRANNAEKEKERQKSYRAANKNKIKESNAVYRLANKDSIKEKSQIYKAKNKESIDLYNSKYREENKEKCIAASLKSMKKNPEPARESWRKRRALKLKVGGELSKNLSQKLFVLQKGKCACCKGDLLKLKIHLDHIMPLSRGGSNTDNNIQLLCSSCNCSKNAKHPVDFMRSRGYLL
jgi:5-methylcytosine-specific restriction endonuclease McrA